ncbi:MULTISPECIES: GNAT family N-acetyltransferase [Oceanobacillus]|uniref:GNAT family N-acetyltransferase n=1 Tax=Oceanobacillus TaxID=182709 RepID=UPI002116B662|nr:GNAT family N-acetyltransferase [Oceanobacillus oncorhynchi]UUI41465.1 GNAT family N-acetyltransferase [Oceanobacillus oncorhynchi]
MQFKSVVEADLISCSKLFLTVFNGEPWNDKWTLEKAKQYLADFYRTPGFFGVSAIENEEIIGFIFGTRRAWWNGDEFFINEMCVDTDRQNKGIGKELLHHLREVMETEAVTAISLLTDRGIPAEAFYKRNGFKEIERLVFLSREV